MTKSEIMSVESGYATTRKSRLNEHRDTVHKKMLYCEKCPFTSFLKGHLKTHIEEVHNNIKKHECEHCGFPTSGVEIFKFIGILNELYF